MTQVSEPAMRGWIELFRAYRRARHETDGALRRAGLPPLEHYDILWELERAGPGGLRPYELERALLLPQYGVSRMVERLCRDGHVSRARCNEDRRGFRLRVTEEGRKLRQEIWAVYAPVIASAMGCLSGDDLRELPRLLSAVARENP